MLYTADSRAATNPTAAVAIRSKYSQVCPPADVSRSRSKGMPIEESFIDSRSAPSNQYSSRGSQQKN